MYSNNLRSLFRTIIGILGVVVEELHNFLHLFLLINILDYYIICLIPLYLICME